MPQSSNLNDILAGLRSTPGAETLSLTQLIQIKLKQITSGNIDTVELDESTQASADVDVQSSLEFVLSKAPSGELNFI